MELDRNPDVGPSTPLPRDLPGTRRRLVQWLASRLHHLHDRVHRALHLSRQSARSPAWELLIIPVTFLGANFFEWWIHRFVMHRPSQVRAFRAIYNRHTLMHHQFFTDSEMRFADHRDWRVTFFPPYALATFTLMSIPLAIVAGLPRLAECRMASDLDDDVDVSDLRIHAFLLPCRRELVRPKRPVG